MCVVHVLSGETRYFRAWQDAKAFMLAKLMSRDETGKEG